MTVRSSQTFSEACDIFNLCQQFWSNLRILEWKSEPLVQIELTRYINTARLEYRNITTQLSHSVGGNCLCEYGIIANNLYTWIVVLRIYVALANFQPYCDLEAGDNQSLKS